MKFGASSILKNIDKETYLHSGYGMTFDSADSRRINNDTARNVKIFGVDNSSSSHSDNRKNNFLVLGEGPAFGINGSFDSPEKKVDISFSNANKKFCLILHYLMDSVLLRVVLEKYQEMCILFQSILIPFINLRY